MAAFATAGSKLFIGNIIDDKGEFVEADFASQTWTEITGLENIGSFGDTSESITYNVINKARTQKMKGTRNAGDMELVMVFDATDAGQLSILAAEKTPYDYAFKLVFPDAPTGGTPSQRLFIAKVMNATEEAGEANSVFKLNATLGINSNIVRINAAAAAAKAAGGK